MVVVHEQERGASQVDLGRSGSPRSSVGAVAELHRCVECGSRDDGSRDWGLDHAQTCGGYVPRSGGPCPALLEQGHCEDCLPMVSGGPLRPGDQLKHHSVPGVYEVKTVMHDGRVILLDPRGERQRVWPEYVRENFTRRRVRGPINPDLTAREFGLLADDAQRQYRELCKRNACGDAECARKGCLVGEAKWDEWMKGASTDA